MHELFGFFEAEQPRVNKFLSAEIEKLHPLVRSVARDVFAGGGKRLRPLLLLLVARSLGCTRQDEALYSMASSLEFLHSATLLHDDILDGAEMRRGAPAAHTIHGVSTTILAGDALLALSNKLMADTGNPKLTTCIAEAIINTAVGEIAEIAHIRDASLTEDGYIEIITGKTAYLIQAACRCGAIACDASPDVEQAAADYGLFLGIAFQLVDDALDYASSQEKLGKPVGRDLREGKVTLPLLYYLQQAGDADRAWALERLSNVSTSEEDYNALVAAIRDIGGDSKTRELAADYLERAGKALSMFPDSREKDLLQMVLNYVLTREK